VSPVLCAESQYLSAVVKVSWGWRPAAQYMKIVLVKYLVIVTEWVLLGIMSSWG
jgi:hypothetical protein